MRSTCFAPCYRSAQLQSPSPLYVCRAGGTRGGEGIGKQILDAKPVPWKELVLLLAPSRFSDLPLTLHVRKKKHQFMAKAGSPFEQGSNLWFWRKKTCVPSNLHKMFYLSYNHVNMWPESRELNSFFLFFYISIYI